MPKDQAMTELLPTIRNAVRAVIIKDERVLLLRKEYEDGSELYALPGGGQDTGETLEAALKRECLEEIGCDVELCELLQVADYFKPRPTTPPSRRHLLELLFRCSVPADYTPGNGSHPDKHQVDVTWVAVGDVHRLPMMPASLANVLGSLCERSSKTASKSLQQVYIGVLDKV
jgi:ADP-ribose pyrophosphatase YjhB (NUDIX family)